MDAKKLGCIIEYSMNTENKIVIKGRKYGITQLMFLSGIVMFLGLTLAIMGLMRCMQYHDWKGIIDTALGVIVILIGFGYKTAASEAKSKAAGKKEPDAAD